MGRKNSCGSDVHVANERFENSQSFATWKSLPQAPITI